MGGFSGGIHPNDRKEKSLINASITAKVPDIVRIPLIQHIGAPAKAIVKPGDTVHVGTRIAEPGGFISAAVHSSVSGKVKRIINTQHPVTTIAPAIEIESDGDDTLDPYIKDRENVDSLSPADIIEIVKEAGIVGMGGASFPTHVKLSPPPGKTIDTLIINGAECEPYLTCDHLVMLYNTVELIKGIQQIKKAVGAKKAYIGIEKNKMDAVEVLLSKLRAMNITDIEVRPLKVKYPQGAEKQLIKSITDREVPRGGLPMDVGIVVQNVGTAFAVYEAVYKGKPLYERLLTVAGRSVKMWQNVKVRIGSSFNDAIKAVGGMIDTPVKVIMGGPMMGIAQETLDVPVIKSTSGILTIGKGEFKKERIRPCIRCGRCEQVCPMGLVPSAITLAGESDQFLKAEELGVRDCMECGSCAYVCPAKRPMVQSVKRTKLKLMQLKRKQEKNEK